MGSGNAGFGIDVFLFDFGIEGRSGLFLGACGGFRLGQQRISVSRLLGGGELPGFVLGVVAMDIAGDKTAQQREQCPQREIRTKRRQRRSISANQR